MQLKEIFPNKGKVFSSGPVVKTLPSNAEGRSLIYGQGAKIIHVPAKLLQSCLTLCNPMDCSIFNYLGNEVFHFVTQY